MSARTTEERCNCADYDRLHDAECPAHPDHDPTPWCHQCGARKQEQCDCGPIADNN